MNSILFPVRQEGLLHRTRGSGQMFAKSVRLGLCVVMISIPVVWACRSGVLRLSVPGFATFLARYAIPRPEAHMPRSRGATDIIQPAYYHHHYRLHRAAFSRAAVGFVTNAAPSAKLQLWGSWLDQRKSDIAHRDTSFRTTRNLIAAAKPYKSTEEILKGPEMHFQAGVLEHFVTTNAGVRMPREIYSCSFKKDRTEDLVLYAVSAGFRAFDTASGRGAGERAVGAALMPIITAGNNRETVFIQTKFNPVQASKIYKDMPLKDMVAASVLDSLKNLQVEYIDSLVLHGPYKRHERTMEAWRVMEEAVRSGYVRQLGVANFDTLRQLTMIHNDAQIKPAVVWQRAAKFDEQQNEQKLYDWCAKSGVYIQQTATLTANKKLTGVQTIQDMAARYNVTPNVLFSRYVMGLGVVPVSGTATEEYMQEDASAWQVPLTSEDAELIRFKARGERQAR